MQRIFSIFTAILLASSAQSQIAVDNYLGEYKRAKFTKETAEQLKARTTYFIIKDFENADEFEKAIKQVWTITPLECVSQKQYEALYAKEQPGNYIALRGMNVDMYWRKQNPFSGNWEERKGPSITNVYLRFLTMGSAKDWANISKVVLHPNSAMLKTLMGKKIPETESMRNQALIYDLTPGMYKIYLQVIADHINRVEERKLWDSMKDKDEMENLKSDTLFIPDYVLIHFDKFNGNESKRSEHDMMSGYKYPYKILTGGEISNLIVNSKKTIYILDYVKDVTTKFVTIYKQSTAGAKIIYSDITNITYNIKAKDFEKIF